MTNGNSDDETTDGDQSDLTTGRPDGQGSPDSSNAEDPRPEGPTTDSPPEQNDGSTPQSADSPVEMKGSQPTDGEERPSGEDGPVEAGLGGAAGTSPGTGSEVDTPDAGAPDAGTPDVDTPDVNTPGSIEDGPSVDGFSGDVDLEDLDLDAESDGEADEASRGLFDDLLEGEPIFGNKEVLRPSYTPERLPHREEQINNMATILVSALRGDTPSNILIYGKTGTGKTASAKFVSEELETTPRSTRSPARSSTSTAR